MTIKTRSRGFTLIEIIVVITLLGIIAAVAVPSYRDMQVDAKSSCLRASLTLAREAISIWHAAAKTRGDTGGTGLRWTVSPCPMLY